jgi:hypothetical protein
VISLPWIYCAYRRFVNPRGFLGPHQAFNEPPEFPLFSTGIPYHIRSHEHENGIASTLDADITQTDRQTSAVGIEFMASPKPLKATLESDSGLGDERAKSNRPIRGRTFDAVEM